MKTLPSFKRSKLLLILSLFFYEFLDGVILIVIEHSMFWNLLNSSSFTTWFNPINHELWQCNSRPNRHLALFAHPSQQPAHYRGHEEDSQLEHSEHQAVLAGRGALTLRLRGIKRSLQPHPVSERNKKCFGIQNWGREGKNLTYRVSNRAENVLW